MNVRWSGVLVGVVSLAVGGAWVRLVSDHSSTGGWPGVDEAVVDRVVVESGRTSRPLLDWVHGDLLLFAFLVAGLAAGFVLGFYARSVVKGPGQRGPS